MTDNRFIGMIKVSGTDFDDGVIPAGADLNCDYEILDSGNIVLAVSVPSIKGIFHSGHNFYSRQDGQIDFSHAAVRIAEDADNTMERLDAISTVVDDAKLEQARQKLAHASRLDPDEPDAERTQDAMEAVLTAKRLLAQVRKDHLKEIRQLDLDRIKQSFDDYIREYARPSEETAFDNLVRTAQRDIDRGGTGFENHCGELRGKSFEILWRRDWFVIRRFKRMAQTPYNFSDQNRFVELVATGEQLLQADNIDALRRLIIQLEMIHIVSGSETEMLDVANIIRG